MYFSDLLLSSGTTYTAEVIAGWRLSEAGFEDPHPCEVTHYNFDAHHDSLNILRLLDTVRDGFFRVVLVFTSSLHLVQSASFWRGRPTPCSLTRTTMGHY